MSITKAGSHTVALPRATDAIGVSLRAAFGAPALPAEMEQLIRHIDANCPRH